MCTHGSQSSGHDAGWASAVAQLTTVQLEVVAALVGKGHTDQEAGLCVCVQHCAALVACVPTHACCCGMLLTWHPAVYVSQAGRGCGMTAFAPVRNPSFVERARISPRSLSAHARTISM